CRDLAFLVADAKPETALEHEPGLVVGSVDVRRSDRAARMRARVGPLRDHEGVADDHESRSTRNERATRTVHAVSKCPPSCSWKWTTVSSTPAATTSR